MIKVLLVEDDNERAKELIEKFKLEDIDITYVQDGKEAMDEIAKQKFTFIISDVNMPRMNGLELIEHVDGKVPALLYTSSHNSDLIEVVNWLKKVNILTSATVNKIAEQSLKMIRRAVEENTKLADKIKTIT